MDQILQCESPNEIQNDIIQYRLVYVVMVRMWITLLIFCRLIFRLVNVGRIVNFNVYCANHFVIFWSFYGYMLYELTYA